MQLLDILPVSLQPFCKFEDVRKLTECLSDSSIRLGRLRFRLWDYLKTLHGWVALMRTLPVNDWQLAWTFNKFESLSGSG
jgi:hypothetical protein